MLDKEPIQLSASQLVIGTLTVVLSFLWYMSNFLTLREHNEFVFRFNTDITRLETEEQRQNRETMSKREFDAWKNERDTVIKQLRDEISRLSRREDERHDLLLKHLDEPRK